MKKIFLFNLFLLLSFKTYAQSNDIIIGNLGQYGVATYMGGTIEGVLQDDGRGGLYISDCCGVGPYIIIENEYVKIGGVYNKYIDYSAEASNPYLSIDIFKDTAQKIKLKNIRYSSNRKITTPCINGEDDTRNQIYETFNGNLQQLIEVEIKTARSNISGYNPDYILQYKQKKNKSEVDVQSTAQKIIPNKIKNWQNKKTFTSEDCDKIFEDVMLAENNKMLNEAVILISIQINKCKSSGKLYDSTKYRAKLYYENSEYKKALSDLIVCESLIRNDTDNMKKVMLYDDLKDCYEALGDINNSKKYQSKSDSAFKERRDELDNTDLPNNVNEGSNKKYCVNTIKGRYEITLLDDKTYTVYYKLYDKLGKLIKTVQGKWTLKDEGAYGPAYRLTINFTGVNSNLPAMKFTCQYDGNGTLQALIDNQDRTWNWCK